MPVLHVGGKKRGGVRTVADLGTADLTAAFEVDLNELTLKADVRLLRFELMAMRKTYEARGVVVPDRLGVTERFENRTVTRRGVKILEVTKLVWTVTHAAASRAADVPGLQDLLLHSRVLGRASGQELQNELGGFRLAGTGLATARDMRETRRKRRERSAPQACRPRLNRHLHS